MAGANGWTQRVLAIVAIITLAGVVGTALITAVSFISNAVAEEVVKPLESRIDQVENAVGRNDEAHKAIGERLNAIDITLREIRDKL